ncbi:MAG: hypothetical protein CMD01_03900 [Flavobacteriales bacterium]|nr:hypothetical protein [Flavobacteriales bacterium]
MTFTRYLFFSLFIFPIALFYGQEYSFIPYSVEDGLSQTQVHSICSDSLGNLWVGTGGGVSKFDGKSFVNYSKENGLADNSSVELKHQKGFVWIATKKGISRIKDKQLATLEISSLVKDNHINSIEFDKKNQLWIAIQNVGLVETNLISIDDFSVEKVNLHNPKPNLFIRSIKCDQKGRIWIGGKGYIGYLENEKWNELILPSNTSNVSDIDQDSDGLFWISTYDRGVFSYDMNQNTFTHYDQKHGLISSTIRGVFIDSKNRIWLSSKNGASRIENKTIKNFNKKNGLLEENINTISEDLEQNIWFGTDGSGTYRFTGEQFVNYTTRTGLPSNYVMSICQDQQNNFWLSTYDEGICCLKNNSTLNYNIKNSAIKNNTVWSSVCTKDNQLYFGTSGGLVKIKNGEITTYSNESWLPSNKITSLYEDEKNRLWIGCSKGLAIIDKNIKYTFNTSSGFKGKKIRSICAFENQIVVGSSTGIFAFDSELNSKKITLDKSISGTIYCLENWQDSLLFIGTGNGLFIYNKKSIYQLHLHTSFSANYINFLKLDHNTLWIGTNFGVFELDLKSLAASTIDLNHYAVANGLKSVETNLNASYVDKKGNIWMGTGKGLTKFNKHEYSNQKNINNPIAQINDVQLFLKPTLWKKYSSSINPYNQLPEKLILASKKNYLTFYFSAANLSRNSSLSYQFMLKNFDESWSPNYQQNSFTYANLPPGNYTFKVRASTDNVNWGKSAEFSFKIDYPYYLKWWFIVIEVTLLCLIIFILWKWRTNVIQRNINTQNLVYKTNLLSLEQQSLNASMNRHFIFNALNSIQYFINTSDKLSANKYLSSFAKLIRKNLDSSLSENNLVSLADELERLELYLSLEHMRFKTKFDYQLHVDSDVQTEAIKVPAMFMQPFVENSIWHGILPKNSKGEITISISYKNTEDLYFTIEDNGIGVQESLKSKGVYQHSSKGLNITSNRIEVLRRLTQKNFEIIGPKQLNNEKDESIGTKVEIILRRNPDEKIVN